MTDRTTKARAALRSTLEEVLGNVFDADEVLVAIAELIDARIEEEEVKHG